MATLKFKRGIVHNYEATAEINGKTYLWGISNGSCNYWGMTVYCNGMMIHSDGWESSSKKSWVIAANQEYNHLLEGKYNPFHY